MSAEETAPVEVIRIIFTTEDVRSMAEDAGIEPEIALDRVFGWAKYITDTMSGYCSEQLQSVIETDQP